MKKLRFTGLLSSAFCQCETSSGQPMTDQSAAGQQAGFDHFPAPFLAACSVVGGEECKPPLA